MRSSCSLAWTLRSCLVAALVGCGTPAAPSVPAGADTVTFAGGLDAGKTDASKDSSAGDATVADHGIASHDTLKSDAPASPADTVAPTDSVEPAEDIVSSPDVPTGPVCGNGQCESPESAQSCPADCPAGPPVCGDAWCQIESESPSLCPIDCDAGAVAVLTCLKAPCAAELGVCLGSKACILALGEAMSCLSSCGGGSNCDVCGKIASAKPGGDAVVACGFAQCGSASPDGFCGDDECGSKESAVTCLADCQGGGGPVCGDGTCTPPENASQCPADCKAANACGDGKCQAGESNASCPADCKGPAPMCGDAVCQANETVSACPFDCDPAIQPSTACGKLKCGKQSDACFTDPECAKILSEALACLKKCGGTQACTNSCAGPVLGNDLALALASCGQQECPPP